MKKIVVVGVLGLVLGGAIGYALHPEAEVPADVPEARPTVRGKITDAGEGAALAGLRARVVELERQLRTSGAEVVTVRVASAEAESRRGWGPRGPEQMRAEMERIRREEPERYQRMTNFMARARAARAVREQTRRSYFADIGTEGMTTAEKKTHARLQELLAERAELDESMAREDLTDEARRQLFEQRHATERELRALNEAERSTLLRQATSALGYEGEAAEEIIGTVYDIFDATETHHGPPPGMPLGDRRGGGSVTRPDAFRFPGAK